MSKRMIQRSKARKGQAEPGRKMLGPDVHQQRLAKSPDSKLQTIPQLSTHSLQLLAFPKCGKTFVEKWRSDQKLRQYAALLMLRCRSW
jgi:hypothetical protein